MIKCWKDIPVSSYWDPVMAKGGGERLREKYCNEGRPEAFEQWPRIEGFPLLWLMGRGSDALTRVKDHSECRLFGRLFQGACFPPRRQHLQLETACPWHMPAVLPVFQTNPPCFCRVQSLSLRDYIIFCLWNSQSHSMYQERNSI